MAHSRRTKSTTQTSRNTSSSSGGSSSTSGSGKVKKGHEDFRNHLFKILREIYSDTGITRQAIDVLNSIMNHLFEVLAAESSGIMKKTSRTTLTANDIQNAVRKVLPGELQKHAVSEGTKAVAKFKSFYVNE